MTHLQTVLDMALMLIEDGTSTIEAAFMDAIERQNKICLDAIVSQQKLSTINASMDRQTEEYSEVFKLMSKSAYDKIKSKK